MTPEEQKKYDEALKEAEKVKELTSQNEQLVQLRDYVSQDPTMLEILKQRKENPNAKLKVTTEEVSQSQSQSLRSKLKPSSEQRDTAIESLNLEDMTRGQFMTHICNTMADAIAPAVEEVVNKSRTEATEQVTGEIQRLSKGLDVTQRALLTQFQETSHNKMKDKYPDYEKFEQKARDTARTRGFTLEEAYFVEKGRGVSEEVSSRDVGSERPTHTFMQERRPSSTQTRANAPTDEARDGRGDRTLQRRGGKSAFRDILQSGMKSAGVGV